jgi:predicted kinase
MIIRGNSGSGKSSVARMLRARAGRGVALLEQDYMRRVLLRERDQPGGAAPALIDHTARYCLDHGYDVVLEGILAASHHAAMLSGLVRAHRGSSFVFYLDVSFEETLRRHATRPQASEFSGEDCAAGTWPVTSWESRASGSSPSTSRSIRMWRSSET